MSRGGDWSISSNPKMRCGCGYTRENPGMELLNDVACVYLSESSERTDIVVEERTGKPAGGASLRTHLVTLVCRILAS